MRSLRRWIPGTPYLTRCPWLGTGSSFSQDPPEILSERRQKCLLSQRSAGVLAGTQEFYVFLWISRARKARQLGSGSRNRPPMRCFRGAILSETQLLVPIETSLISPASICQGPWQLAPTGGNRRRLRYDIAVYRILIPSAVTSGESNHDPGQNLESHRSAVQQACQRDPRL